MKISTLLFSTLLITTSTAFSEEKTRPEANGRYMALQIIDEDYYSPFDIDKPGKYELWK